MNGDAELLLLYADGECSAEEAHRAEALLRESPPARAEYAALLRGRMMLAEVLARPALAASSAPLVVVDGAGESRARTAPSVVIAPRHSKAWLGVLAAAAALVIAATAHWVMQEAPSGAGYVISGTEAAAARREIEYGRPVEAGSAEEVNLLLGDRSVLSVAPSGRVVVDAPRRVRLEDGGVRVACRKDPLRKFVVSAAGATVTALGTEFAVTIDEDLGEGGGIPRFEGEMKEGQPVGKLVRVVVFSGAVLLAGNAGQLRLAAGEKGEVKGKGKPEKVKKDKDEGKGEGRGRGDERGVKAGDLEKLGDYVKELHGQGLRGRELAEAIQKKLEELKGAKDARRGERGHGKGRGRGDGEGRGKGHGKGRGRGDGEGKGHGKGRGDGDGEGRGRGHGRRDGDAEGKGKKHQHKHGDGEGKGKKHQHKHGDGDGEGKGKKHQHKHGDGDGEGKGKKHQHKHGDDEPGAGGEGHGKGHGRDKDKGEGHGRGKGKAGGGGHGKGQGRGGGKGRGKGRGRGRDRDKGEGAEGGEGADGEVMVF